MSLTPQSIAARDQLNASIRDVFDRHEIDIEDPHDRLTVMGVVWLVATAAGAFRDSDMDAPEQRLHGISYVLESIMQLVERSCP